jgi:hypothetical protein
LPVNGIGQDEIYNGRQDDKCDKIPAGLVKEIEGTKAEKVIPYFKIIPEIIIEGDEDGKEDHKETIVKKQWVVRIVQELL